jgi:hypothetical protein
LRCVYFWENALGQDLKRVIVAEPERLVGGHRLDDLLAQRTTTAFATQLPNQITQRRDAVIFDHPAEAALHEIMLVIPQQNSAGFLEKTPEVLVLSGADAYQCQASDSFSSSLPRPEA